MMTEQQVGGSGEELTVAVLTDMHAFAYGRADGPSHLHTAMPEDDEGAHPMVALEALVKREQLSADVLLCGGDLGDRADRDGIFFAWALVHRLAKRLSAATVLATAGNHDMDSRYIDNKWSPREVLQRLRPRFPVDDLAKCDQYWSRNYAVVHGPHCRIVTLNSCAYHGGASGEKDHGRVTRHTLVELERELRGMPEAEVNVLLCHHHPVQFVDVGDDDYDVMEGGPRLLELLRTGEMGRWIIVHGHRHVPHLTYALGGAASPVIFSAASFSVDLHRAQQTQTRNQFYLLRFPLAETRRLGLALAGRFQSWYWVTHGGWEPTPRGSGLPASGGFGWRVDGRNVAARLAAHMRENGRASLDWEDLRQVVPEIVYLTPEDLKLTGLEIGRLGAKVRARDSGGIEKVEL
jgi:3',5'-cyclic AMP phosphodiesterase CpdA